MRKTLLISVVALLLVPSFAVTQPGRLLIGTQNLSKVADGPCAVGGLSGPRGLCIAYCEALDCDGEVPRGSAESCGALFEAYVAQSDDGAWPPCVEPSPYACLPTDIELPATIELRRATGLVETLDFEDYLKGVLPGEIGTSADIEAMKAQAIASRSYALRWVREGRGPICDNVTCQVYRDNRYLRTDQAVDETAGVVGTYDGEVIWGYFHASSGGRTESAADVWGIEVPYLVSVPDLQEHRCTGSCEWWPDDAPLCPSFGTLPEGCCYGNGRRGHGIGLSQRGAISMADCGYDHIEILEHFYTGITLAAPCD